MGQQCLFPGAVVKVVGFLQVLQDDVHCLQDITSCARISGDLRDGGHAKVLEDLGHITHQGCQSTSLDDTVRLSVLKKLPELNELHQLITIVSGVESPVLRLHQHRLA
jgi:hypothetical protein